MQITQGSKGWQLDLEGPNGVKHTNSGFDAVLLAVPAPQALPLLAALGDIGALNSWVSRLGSVKMAPCWTLMLAFDGNKVDSSVPLWNAARSSSHSIAWLARENSKPGRGAFERWIVQASHAWSERHFDTDKVEVHRQLVRAPFLKSLESCARPRTWTRSGGAGRRRSRRWGTATCGTLI